MIGRVFSNEPLTPLTQDNTSDDLLKVSADELIIKDLEEL